MKKLAPFALLLAGVAGVTGAAGAEQIKPGATACRNQQALVEIRAAQRSGDEHTIQWLYEGTACVKLNSATEVDVIATGDDGAWRLRTVNRRRNIELWVSADQLETI